ncbi:hypothetical protein [Arenibaculum pallidiluteum]|uniref:hypothetical protein n=1 Tax=Arenibaculum pallidiluteum TaxID=2812559 RepID=UPI001A966074|nr:hypothetical protein [Arenibaculum pallidiluteum]
MTVLVEMDAIHLKGDCPVDEAEIVLQALLANPGLPVDWSECEGLHTAVLQVLMAARATLTGSPRDQFLRLRVAAALSSQAEA